MREIYPPHYAAFHCIAGACPDSCCKEWEIVVDAESVEKYQMVSGELGNRLRQAMITDADGDVFFKNVRNAALFGMRSSSVIFTEDWVKRRCVKLADNSPE